VDVGQFGSPDAATEAFDEPLDTGAVEAIIGPFFGPPAPPPAT
jgi:hypothetical protein